jgi:hypothetical protein
MRTTILILGFLLALGVMSSTAAAQCGGRGFVSVTTHHRVSYGTHGYGPASRHGHYYPVTRYSAFRHSGRLHHR